MASKLPARDILMSCAPADAARVSRLPSPTSALVPDLLDKAFSLGTGGDTLGMVDLVATSHCKVVYWEQTDGTSLGGMDLSAPMAHLLEKRTFRY
ncbi:hypothetical protein C1645_876104 [Glomus cerebriforme]|uniref:Uncharacterized protein n=1 Tax=Glomus cerebriforme TaxID=658196 RepID=A0A397SWG9_9GLOM|nr:hypothetical protein C1645_876104 [Glomus cerebriforme]